MKAIVIVGLIVSLSGLQSTYETFVPVESPRAGEAAVEMNASPAEGRASSPSVSIADVSMDAPGARENAPAASSPEEVTWSPVAQGPVAATHCCMSGGTCNSRNNPCVPPSTPTACPCADEE